MHRAVDLAATGILGVLLVLFSGPIAGGFERGGNLFRSLGGFQSPRRDLDLVVRRYFFMALGVAGILLSAIGLLRYYA